MNKIVDRQWPAFDALYPAWRAAHRPARAVAPVPMLHFGVLIEIRGGGDAVNAYARQDHMADCKDAGVVTPVIDRSRCEAKADCVDVCPYHVFEIRRLAPADKAGLSWLARVKARVHGDRQAFVVRGADCHACGLCVSACPERAIKLARSDHSA